MTLWHPTDDGYADLSSHDAFSKGVPHNTFSRLRDEQPVAWYQCKRQKGFWSITRHADILELNPKTDLLSSAQGIRMEDQSYEEYMARRTFQETDPPEHTRTRQLVARAFSRKVIMKYEQMIEGICNAILDEGMDLGEFNAAQKISRQLPMRMLGPILGVPDQDLDWLVAKGDELIGNTDPEFSKLILDQDDTDAYRLMPFRSPAGAELWDYAECLMAQKKKRGDDSGVLNLVMQPDAEGKTMSSREFRNFFCLLVAAGNDTTRYTLSASIHALTQQRGLLEQLQSGNSEIWSTATDEFIRWASPTMYFRRTATRDFTFHDQTICKGDKVLLWFVSANRDRNAFDRPFRIDPLRKPNRHLAFGQGGPHLCLGMWLARLEVRVLMEKLCNRIKSITLTEPVKYTRSNFVGGIKYLAVSVR